MHSNYGGGVSEMQQFMMDGCPSSLFSISTSPPPPPPQNSNSGTSEVQKFHPLQHHLQQQQPPPMPPHFAHFGQPIPITQQLFQQSHHHHVHHHHQFQLFQQQQQQQQQQMGLDQESGPENSNSPARMMGGGGGGPSFLAAMNFKLGVNESSGGGGGGGGSRDGINEDEGILQGDDDGSESRLHHHHHQHRHPWHREEESAAAAANIKEPFWRPLDIDFINPNNKRPAKDKQPAAAAATTAEISSSSSIKHFKKSNDSCAAAATDSNYKLFSELEAIYKPGGGGVGGGGGETNNNQTGSGSALTGDDNPLVPVTAPGPTAEHGQPDNISDTSNADDAPQKKTQKDDSNSGDGVRRKRSRKRRQQKHLSSIATFFESLVKQLMDHQESLHRKFLDVMEKKDRERSAREEACRKQEAAKANREAAARAQERALAATREAAIISFLEKISGESLNLPTKAQFQSQFTEECQQKDNNEENAVEIYNADSTNNNVNNSGGGGLMQFNSSRWPKAEVHALIRVRSGFESKFQEPGLKGPLWEEVSLAMATMGYQRSAKRCKEKWENINKYFRKTKDSGKKRPQHSKTCPYFQQLDQLYSKTPPLSNANHGRKETNSELLDAIVVSNEAKRNEEGNEEEGQGESQDQEENADDGDRSPVRMEQNQEHNSSDHHLLNRLNS